MYQIIQDMAERSLSASGQRQHHYSSVPKQTGYKLSPSARPHKDHLRGSTGVGSHSDCALDSRQSKSTSGLSFQNTQPVRVDVTSLRVSTNRLHVGSPLCGQVRLRNYCTTTQVQQPVLGSAQRSSGCPGPGYLARREQLCQPTIFPVAKGHFQDPRDSVSSHSRGSKMAHAELVSGLGPDVGGTSPVAPSFRQVDSTQSGSARASEKQEVVAGNFEDLWARRLRSQGWSEQAVAVSLKSYSDSTWTTYNRWFCLLRTYAQSCDKQVEQLEPAALVDFTIQQSQGHRRPKSVLTQISAMMACFARVTGTSNKFTEDVYALCHT